MGKIEELNRLFIEWENAQSVESEESLSLTINGKNIRKDFFEIDGIIDEDAFEKEEIKVLFVSAEANCDEYGAAKGVSKTDYKKDYIEYYKTGYDSWRGKMRERICALYGFITNQKDKELHLLANKFAVLDLNKRGGRSQIDNGLHIVEYTKVYKHFIRKEIKIIDPDLIVWIGNNIYNLGIPELLGSISRGMNKYLLVNGKEIPILRMWQTSYYQAKIEPLPEYKNRIIGKLCAKAKMEMERFHIEFE